MNKTLLTFCIVAVAGSVFAQSLNRSLLSRRKERSRLVSEPQLLEPLLPFAEAIEKAKANDPRGWYALAVHYTRWEVVKPDFEKMEKCFEKASSLNYSNAVFVCAMMLEEESNQGLRSEMPKTREYIGARAWRSKKDEKNLITNSAYVAKVKAEYERAFRLGVSAATNELARFERRVKADQVRIEEKRKRDEENERNVKLADELLQNL